MNTTDRRPRISVVLPTYQGDAWITECLDSLAAQTIPREQFEVVLVQNGPASRTGAIVEAWLAEHPGFALAYLLSDAPGVSAARNLGLDHAQGEYVTFVDDDDRVGPQMLAALLEVAAPDVIGGVLAGFVTDGDYSKASFDNWYSAPLIPARGRAVGRRETHVMLQPTWAKVVRTEIAREVRFDERIPKGQDTVFWVSVAARHQLRHVVAQAGVEAAYLYNIRQGSLRQFASGPTWEHNVEARVRMAAALAAIPVADPEVAQIRDDHYDSIFRVEVHAYLRTHPAERDKVLAAARAAGATRIPWKLLNRGLARELAVVGADPSTARHSARRLAARGAVVDVLTYTRAERPSTLTAIEELVDNHFTISGPASLTWDLVEQMVAAMLTTVDSAELRRGAPYLSLFSCSARPLEHLVAAGLKAARPEWSWTADAEPSRASAADRHVPVGDGPVARQLLSLLTARGVVAEGPTTMGALCDAVIDALADGATTAEDRLAAAIAPIAPAATDSDRADDPVAIAPDEGDAPQVSVILPTHRGDQWIAGCLDSLAAQTLPWSDFEVVVVANGPRTSTPQIVADWASAHPGLRLRLLQTERAGVSHARNLGLDAARGRYVTFVDDDDQLAPRMLQTLLAAAHPGVIAMAPVGFFRERADEPDFENWYSGALRPFIGRPARTSQLYPALTGPWAKLVLLDLARRTRFREELTVAEDRVFWLELLAAEPVSLIFAEWCADAAYLYQVRERSASGHGAARDWDGFARPWLDGAAALVDLDVRRPETAQLREIAYGYLFGNFLRSYATEHPEDAGRLRRALDERGLGGDAVPWQLMFDKLAREVLFLGDAAGGVETDGVTDLVSVATRGGEVGEVGEGPAYTSGAAVDAHVVVTAPTPLTWSDFTELAAQTRSELEKQEATKPGPYVAALSVSSSPVDHLLAALFKLARPTVSWTAELVVDDPGATALGVGTAVEADLSFQVLGAGLIEAGYPVEEIPEQLELFAEMVTLGLADRVVFEDAVQADRIIGRCPVPEIAARARTVAIIAVEQEGVA